MRGLDPSQLSPDFIEANRPLLEAAGIIPRTLPQEPVPPPPPMERPAEGKAPQKRRFSHSPEKKLQADCRNGLLLRGYVELTHTNAAEHAADAKGWFGHLAKPQGNPIMPDLFVFDARMNRCLMVELKTNNVFQVGQKEMLEAGNWEIATSYGEFVTILENWEKKLLPGAGSGRRR